MFSRDFTDIKSGESFDVESNLFSDISRQNDCVQKYLQKYCSADFKLAVRFEMLLFHSRVFFLSHCPLTSTRKEIKYKFFIIILLHFRV